MLNRRAWLRSMTAGGGWVGLITAAEVRLQTALVRAETKQPAKSANTNVNMSAKSARLTPLNRFGRMTQDAYLVDMADVVKKRHARWDALHTRADAENYVNDVRERIRTCFGPMPPRTPLRPEITGRLERDGYVVEKVIFESRPGFFVTSNLYLPDPKRFPGPRPGIVGTCGHSENGKAAAAYQSFAQGLTRQGFIVLIFDPIGQGERLQYVKGGAGADRASSLVGAGVREHLQCGNTQILVGEFHGSWHAWDGIRALDYLLSRPEVDPDRVGVTGNSGGGTLTTWLCGLEPRFRMGAPSCFVTTLGHNLANELAADIEQCPPRMIALGLDHEDCLAAMAPKPIIILAKERDFFDVRGAEEAYKRLKKIYGLLGAEEQIGFFAGPTDHGYSQENREAMYRWFLRACKMPGNGTEPALVLEPDDQLRCLPGGQVGLDRPDCATVPADTALRARDWDHKRRTQPQALATVEEARAFAVRVFEDLKIPMPNNPNPPEPASSILRPVRGRGYPRPHAVTYAVTVDSGIVASVTRLYDQAEYSRPPRVGVSKKPEDAGQGGNRDDTLAVLYVSDQSSDEELRNDKWAATLIPPGPNPPFYACDLRGVGDSEPRIAGDIPTEDVYGPDYFHAAYALMWDDPVPVRRTRDLLRVLDWLRAQGHTRVHLAANGAGTIPACFAALGSAQVTEVTLRNYPSSYAEIAAAPQTTWPLSAFLPGVLKRWDLPLCRKAIGVLKTVNLSMPVGAIRPPRIG